MQHSWMWFNHQEKYFDKKFIYTYTCKICKLEVDIDNIANIDSYKLNESNLGCCEDVIFKVIQLTML